MNAQIRVGGVLSLGGKGWEDHRLDAKILPKWHTPVVSPIALGT
jgi:hypothetical protein